MPAAPVKWMKKETVHIAHCFRASLFPQMFVILISLHYAKLLNAIALEKQSKSNSSTVHASHRQKLEKKSGVWSRASLDPLLVLPSEISIFLLRVWT